MRYGDGASMMGLEPLEEEKERSDCALDGEKVRRITGDGGWRRGC